ncbi:MerR family transcriptional regulator [Pseudogracilibacillus auburnensis]|uniref:DNA-binding transcriptional MerR regulator n=1 Tax=Pseudogracilibacillus auburnensis TaxID=1494959 RepID=A0A2V3WAH9_9BACI|nr:MerR family transcriptional regulator [Pseudogracilibacillus auburnensis]PXW90536.1 DNA-binding transcriptional MerR regulator [Pseudogracilibacillus auburnensis]
MSNNYEKHFTTGEFAKLCKVNKQTLIYYDQIGLFSPIIKDGKGYRYYSLAQYDYFSVIELLKEVGMSLKEIQAYMENKSPENFVNLMRKQKLILQEKIKELKLIENMIDTKIEGIENASEIDFNKITIKHCPKRILYLSKQIKNTTEKQFVEAVSDFIDELYRSKLDTGHPIGAIVNKGQMETGEIENYSYLYMEQPAPIFDLPYFVTKACDYCIGYHFGEVKHISKTYKKMFDYMGKHNYILGEFAYEEYVYDAVIRDDESNYIMKILIEVHSKKSN